MQATVRLGYTVGAAEPVEIPLKHMVVVGQTQESGKTTALEALLARSGVTAVTFVTKRGERSFTGAGLTRIPPYFREKADWVFVSSLIDLTMGGKNKILHSFLMKVCRNTKTLAQVLDNVKAARDQARRGFDESIYQQIHGYLELVVPQLGQLQNRSITLYEGLNVMDLSHYSVELQALCIRSVLDFVYEHAKETVVVLPEAWEFLPEGKGSPVKAAAERLIRKGATLKNYLWIDSQDLGGVWKTAVRACAVVLIGVQREANELKRTLANIPAGISKPTATQVATLGLGQFYACWKQHVIKTYVQPCWMTEGVAQVVARGVITPEAATSTRALQAAMKASGIEFEAVGVVDEEDDMGRVAELEAENLKLRDQVAALEGRLDDLGFRVNQPRVSTRGATDPTRSRPLTATPRTEDAPALPPSGDFGALIAAVKAELQRDPVLLRVAMAEPALQIEVERHVVSVDGTTTLGLMARLVKEGFFDDDRDGPKTATAAWNAMKRYGFAGASARAYEAADKLVGMGFLTKEKDGYRAVKAMKISIKGAA